MTWRIRTEDWNFEFTYETPCFEKKMDSVVFLRGEKRMQIVTPPEYSKLFQLGTLLSESCRICLCHSSLCYIRQFYLQPVSQFCRDTNCTVSYTPPLTFHATFLLLPPLREVGISSTLGDASPNAAAAIFSIVKTTPICICDRRRRDKLQETLPIQATHDIFRNKIARQVARKIA